MWSASSSQLDFYPCCRALPPASSTPVIPPCPSVSHSIPLATPVFGLSIAQRAENHRTKSSKQLKHLGAVYVTTVHSSSVGSLSGFGKNCRNFVSQKYYPSLPLPNLTDVMMLMEKEKGKWKEGEIWAKTDRQSRHIIFVLTEQQTTTTSQLWKHYVLRCCDVFGLSSPFQALLKMNTQRDRSLSHTAGLEEMPLWNRMYVCFSIHPTSILAVFERDVKTSGS